MGADPGSEMRLSPQQIVEEVRADPHDKVKLAVVDIDGVLRGKYVHKRKFLSAVDKGFGFCNVVFGWDCGDVCYDNVRYTGWHTGYPDALARLDLRTYRRVPWDGEVAFFLADFEDEHGKPLAVCPRQTLKRVCARAQALGYAPVFGLEIEWFNFRESPQSLAEKGYAQPTPLAWLGGGGGTGLVADAAAGGPLQPTPLSPGMFGYSILRAGLHRPYFHALMDELGRFRVPLEGLHTETGPGVYEAALLAADALEAADRGVLFKTGVKEIAYRFGIVASFMAKWHARLPGCSGHIHQSLWDAERTTNLFHDDAHPQGMTPLFESYLAGQMALLPELLPMYAPTVNSYKRLVEGLWAPTTVSWGVDNRTAAFRVISTGPGSTRLETRAPGADLNPYLAIAAALGSGLYGIERKLRLEARAVTGNAYAASGAPPLPRTLHEATERLARSEAARELFGEAFVEHFVASRQWEWRQFREAVTDWELKRYFEIV
ncbi:MAG: glutamine synthetase [Planctomycetota bacterium]|nr:MAG: glutamine synthetase [Planctomycetota bacterium]